MGRVRCDLGDGHSDARSDPAALGNDLVFTSRGYTRLVRSFALKQRFVTLLVPAAEWGGGPGDPSVEKVVRPPNVIPAAVVRWITFYRQRRLHQALKMSKSDAAAILTSRSEQEPHESLQVITDRSCRSHCSWHPLRVHYCPGGGERASPGLCHFCRRRQQVPPSGYRSIMNSCPYSRRWGRIPFANPAVHGKSAFPRSWV